MRSPCLSGSRRRGPVSKFLLALKSTPLHKLVVSENNFKAMRTSIQFVQKARVQRNTTEHTHSCVLHLRKATQLVHCEVGLVLALVDNDTGIDGSSDSVAGYSVASDSVASYKVTA